MANHVYQAKERDPSRAHKTSSVSGCAQRSILTVAESALFKYRTQTIGHPLRSGTVFPRYDDLLSHVGYKARSAIETPKPATAFYRYNELVMELKRMVIEAYYDHGIIIAYASAMPDGQIALLADDGPLWANREMHHLACDVILRAKMDRVLLNHDNLWNFRGRLSLHEELSRIHTLKLAAASIKFVKWDYGFNPRYNLLELAFPNCEEWICTSEDGSEHSVVREGVNWVSKDLKERRERDKKAGKAKGKMEEA